MALVEHSAEAAAMIDAVFSLVHDPAADSDGFSAPTAFGPCVESSS